MKLIEIKIENFRGVRSLHLPFDGLTVLIGENNTGKSTVLEAIRLVLTRGFVVRRAGQFTEYDFHLKDANAMPQTADPISITLHFAEEQESEWPDTVVQQMSEVIQ
ncbi:MAG: AAA family ATPase [Desulfobacteraceae bacterium]|jgi:putative ATP-dependent endonuclease of OLD family|nr:AAA family ATPase [Desulfobacteraceae bacterium]